MLEAEHIKLAVSAWLDARGGNRIPKASDFGPFQMRPFLPNVAIFRRVTPGEYRVSLQGTALVEAFGYDATGDNVSSIYPDEEMPGLLALYDLLYSNAYLSHSLRIYTRKMGTRFTIEQLMLPASNEAGEHDRYILLAYNVQMPVRPRISPVKPPRLGDLQERTVYDSDTLLPVSCFATTPRDPADMAIPITAYLP